MKNFQKKVPSYLMRVGRGRQDDLAPLENHIGVDPPSKFARKCRLKLVNVLNLEKRTV